jgi:hypothetical protein
MNSTFALADRSLGMTLRYFFWSHPEWWSVALCGSAWAIMLLHAWQYAGHGIYHRMSFPQEFEYWTLMAMAMMVPFSREAVRLTAARSLWARRRRAIGGFLAGFLAPWLLLGIAVAGLRQFPWTHTYAAPALVFLAAALWQRTSIHGRAFIACYRTQPLAPLGWQADRDCLRFGGSLGIAWIKSCWPLMLACAFAGHNLIAMAGGMAVGAAEHWSFRPRTRVMLIATLLLASYYAALATLNHDFFARAFPQAR